MDHVSCIMHHGPLAEGKCSEHSSTRLLLIYFEDACKVRPTYVRRQVDFSTSQFCKNKATNSSVYHEINILFCTSTRTYVASMHKLHPYIYVQKVQYPDLLSVLHNPTRPWQRFRSKDGNTRNLLLTHYTPYAQVEASFARKGPQHRAWLYIWSQCSNVWFVSKRRNWEDDQGGRCTDLQLVKLWKCIKLSCSETAKVLASRVALQIW